MVCESQGSHSEKVSLSLDLLETVNPLGKKGHFLLVKGYIDESHSADGKGLFVLSCLLGKGMAWQWFRSDWGEVLTETNVALRSQARREIIRYHAADCSSRVGEFQGWTVDEQKALTKKLLEVFSKPSNQLVVVSYSIDLSELVGEIPETVDDPQGFAYSLMLKFIMLDIGRGFWEKNSGNVEGLKISLVHERCDYDTILLQAFNSQMADPTFKYSRLFATIAPLGWEDCEELQPADLLAYEIYKESERQRADGKKRNMRKTLELLLQSDAFGAYAKDINRETIAKLKNLLDAKTSKMLKHRAHFGSDK